MTRFQDTKPPTPTEELEAPKTITRDLTPEGGDAAIDAAQMNTPHEHDASIEERDATDPTMIEPGAAPDDDTTETTEAKPLCDWLGQLLGDVFTEYVQAHSYHWNVSGVQFSQYHDLFSEIASDVYSSIDPIAENILKLGYDAPVGLAQLIAFRELKDPELVPDTPVAMATALLAANMIVLDTLNDAFAQATIENQQGIANFLAERIDQHQKWSWQLRKSIDAQPADQMTPDPDEVVDDTDEEPQVERAYSPIRIQYRSSGAGKQYKIISGYAARTNSMSEDLGGFREIIAPGAFKRVLSENPDVRLLYAHNPEAVLARTGVNLELEEDELGLRIWARVDMNDPDVQRVASKLESGLVDAASFGFTVREDSWEERSGYPIRTIREIEMLAECSLVTWPAYPATRLGIMDEAIRSGRLQLGGAARIAPIMVGAMSREHFSGVGSSAAVWRARLSLKKHTTQR